MPSKAVKHAVEKREKEILEGLGINYYNLFNGRTIAFDFDGTITTRNIYPHIGDIRPGVADCINLIHGYGAEVIIWTCRAHHDQMEAVHNRAYEEMLVFLDFYGIKYHQINRNTEPMGRKPGPKIYACCYIDDKGLGWNPNHTGETLFTAIVEHLQGNNRFFLENH